MKATFRSLIVLGALFIGGTAFGQTAERSSTTVTKKQSEVKPFISGSEKSAKPAQKKSPKTSVNAVPEKRVKQVAEPAKR